MIERCHVDQHLLESSTGGLATSVLLNLKSEMSVLKVKNDTNMLPRLPSSSESPTNKGHKRPAF